MEAAAASAAAAAREEAALYTKCAAAAAAAHVSLSPEPEVRGAVLACLRPRLAWPARSMRAASASAMQGRDSEGEGEGEVSGQGIFDRLDTKGRRFQITAYIVLYG